MPNYYLWLIGALFSLLSFLKKKDGYIGKISRDLSVLASVALQPTMRLVSLVMDFLIELVHGLSYLLSKTCDAAHLRDQQILNYELIVSFVF